MNYKLLSLFTGAGALDYGFERVGHFETSFCFEVQKEYVRTVEVNQQNGILANARLVCADLANPQTLPTWGATIRAGGIDGIIGGPPCESFSQRGRRLGPSDPRSELVFVFASWVATVKPRFFLLENVPRMMEIDNGRLFRRLLGRFRAYGYAVAHKVLCAADYGAATARRRVFIVGIRGGPRFQFPMPSHGDTNCTGLAPYITVADALWGLPAPSMNVSAIPQGHRLIIHTPVVAERFSRLRPGQQDDVRKRTRLNPHAPSPTLVAGNLEGIRSHIHPVEPRELTNRESARLHGFPDYFVFSGTRSAVGKQIANSVPIPLASALAEAISKHLAAAVDPTPVSQAAMRDRVPG